MKLRTLLRKYLFLVVLFTILFGAAFSVLKSKVFIGGILAGTLNQIYYRWSNNDGSELHWYDTTWTYRKPITVTNTSTSTLTNYQVLVTADTSTSGHFKTDCSDVRFTDPYGNVLIDYWVEPTTCNTTTTKFWVEVPSIPNQTSITIYMYYGNAGASAVSSVANTFIREVSNLEVYYPFDSDTNDYSGNGKNGTNTGTTDTATAKFGHARDFSGSSQYVTVPKLGSVTYASTMDYFDRNNSGTGPGFTFEAWARLTDNTTGASRWIFGETPSDTQFFVGQSANGTPDNQILHWKMGFSAGLHQIGDVGSYIFSVNTWHHMVATWDGTTGANSIKLYIDNSVISQIASASTNIDGSDNFYVGRREFAGEYWKGQIDEFRIYSSGISAAEVQDLYNNYGYSTTNYPGKVLVRKYTSPEPTTSVGTEVTQVPSGTSTWKAALSTAVTGISRNDNIRLRFTVKNTGTSTSEAFKLQYAARGVDNSCDTSFTNETYADMPTTSGSAAIMSDSSYLVSGQISNPQLTQEGTFVIGSVIEKTTNTADTVTLAASTYTELEYVFKMTSSAPVNTHYCFRLVRSGGTTLETYTQIPELTTVTGPSKVVFTNSERTIHPNVCNGTAGVLTVELQDAGGTATVPTASTVVRVASTSSNDTIYSDNTCTTPVTNGDFTYTTSDTTKSVYIKDTSTTSAPYTLSATRQSGDTLTTGTQTITLTTGDVVIQGGSTLKGGTAL